ncbi:Ribosyldihydronicotinamide dehydrogenase [Exophiala viscosa]|uniref:Ribosyldihydronicotinamide dehydrogenase n=1 Tax=Exophiala viscosa TaxID=2486360 RepID=A0AAN6DMD8_9EURO|nr:Ribosyldihydronicotinamide dehydrogenase [Exophiala viscosa]KAI1620961.1 Ribosyldihydronicotinamide dehydrogenase [Exophiala viscosa]
MKSDTSDLYAMHWKSQIDRDDFPTYDKSLPLRSAIASYMGHASHTLTADVVAEQEKLLWADFVILQFPLWWYGMPAILKGWFDRVFSCGFAYGIGEHNDKHWGDRYGEGVFKGKRAMLVVTAGGDESNYQARGICGPIEDLLFPVNHGMLFYTGFDVLPPFVAYRSDRMKEAEFEHQAEKLRKRVQTSSSTDPIPYRRQNFGDYDIPALTLRDDIDSGNQGFRIHQKDSGR